jgi:hypothetical protein
VADFAKNVEKENNLENCIRLDWSEKSGLTNINLLSGGLDLNDDFCYSYRFHNFSPESEYGKILFSIAEKYVSLLLEK